MAITQADVRLYASVRMTEFADGGGRMSPTVIVDGLDNNVFTDVTAIDRLSGRNNLRKIFGAVISNDTDTYLSAHALLEDGADDTTIDAVLISFGDYATERAAVAAAFSVSASVSYPVYSVESTVASTYGSSSTYYDAWTYAATSGSATVTADVSMGGVTFDFSRFAVGNLLTLVIAGVGYLRTISSISSAGATLVLDAALPVTGAARISRFRTACPRAYGVSISSAGASSGASTITVASLSARVVPCDLAAPYPSLPNTQWLTAPNWYAASQGRVQVIQANDAVLLHSTIAMTAASVSNGSTTTAPRTDLARLRVIGFNGVEHARFTKGVTAPTGVGCTANLTAGTVTFSDVSGMSQPVTVEHRIEEMAIASAVSIGSGVITLNHALTRDFAAGTKVSSLCMLGDLQGRTYGGFAQTAWTGVFADAVSGGTPTADFNDTLYPITTTNKGAITDRWVLIFTNTTSFRCIGELTGEITGGSTAVDFAPINPATGAPYFTAPALGWGSGWAAGNVYRHNTAGAQAPLWLLRTIAPSVGSGGGDSITAEFRGYVNA